MARQKGITVHRYTNEQIAWLETHRPTLKITELARQFNELFKAAVNPKALAAFANAGDLVPAVQAVTKNRTVHGIKGLKVFGYPWRLNSNPATVPVMHCQLAQSG